MASQQQPHGERKLITVQSHVVSGYVGNRAATFPLQVLGWDVDVVNTVHFSNHTGYGRWAGLRFDAEHIRDLFAGLQRNGLARYDRMLTGYVPSAETLREVITFIQHIKSSSNADLIYLLDPVMGDMGRGMYVSESVVPLYREMIQYATIVCPNQFEAQILAEQDISSLDSLYAALWTLHVKRGSPNVVITSVDLSDEDLHHIGAKSKTTSDGTTLMTLIGSSLDLSQISDSSPDSNPREFLRPWFIQFPEVPGYFSGVGDTFSALLIGRFDPSPTAGSDSSAAPSQIAHAAELAIASLQSILSRTSEAIAHAPALPDQTELTALAKASLPDATQWPTDQAEIDKLTAAQRRVEEMRPRELKIVQSKWDIENPHVVYRASKFASL
ncbi:hypothetical protein CF326_g175 [Tilletia indica]|nr:hypothetical protein CF326_g175 [Tilletia indica]